MRRMAILVLALGPLVAAQGKAGKYATWIQQIGDADAKKAQSARRMLLHFGTPALGELKEAVEATRDEKRRAQLAAIIKEIETREPHGLQFFCGLPKLRLDVDTVNSPHFRYSLSVKNASDKTVVLWPYFALRVLDAKGNEVAPSSRRGRWGRRGRRAGDGPLLVSIPFATIEPGKRWSFADGLKQYMHDPESIVGWKIPAPGTYTLEFTYHYERDVVKKRLGKSERVKWEPRDDPNRPWNRALEFKHTFTCEMEVK